MEVSTTGGSPIAGWLLMENPSINGWCRGTHISGNLQKKCWLVGWWPGGERSRVHHAFPPWMILQADSWPVLLELFLSKLLVSDYLMTVFDEKCSLKSVRYPIISPSILYTHHLGISFIIRYIHIFSHYISINPHYSNPLDIPMISTVVPKTPPKERLDAQLARLKDGDQQSEKFWDFNPGLSKKNMVVSHGFLDWKIHL